VCFCSAHMAHGTCHIPQGTFPQLVSGMIQTSQVNYQLCGRTVALAFRLGAWGVAALLVTSFGAGLCCFAGRGARDRCVGLGEIGLDQVGCVHRHRIQAGPYRPAMGSVSPGLPCAKDDQVATQQELVIKSRLVGFKQKEYPVSSASAAAFHHLHWR
jgi:hypothetical protein